MSLTDEELAKEKASLVRQYEDLKDKMNQTLGAIMWINQQLDAKDKPNG